jgi:hypothetical protein
MSLVRPAALLPALLVVLAARADAQPPATAKKHPAVCARGVSVYHDAKELTMPYDSVEIPRAAAPVRVTSEAEAEAAELDLRARAGSVGATGVIMTTVTDDNGSGEVRMRRSVQGIFVPADSARAQQACAAK